MHNAAQCRQLIEEWLSDGSFDERLPEVAALRDVPQPEQFHAEGDAYVHTMLAMRAVADDADPRVFWGALLHDIGKAETTHFAQGRWRAFGHAETGAELVPGIMARLGFPEMADDVAWLVKHHLFHFSWHYVAGEKFTRNQLRFMEHPLFPLLLEVCAADAAGSIGGSGKGRVIAALAEAWEEMENVNN
jgi:putative nucleotidyltransferase with HDIG domain